MQNENKVSLKINMLLNAIKGIMSVIFPLITFPYVSRALGTDNIGRYGFAASIISYFILISDLGIATYTIREGAALKNDKTKLNAFTNKMFSLNILSTLLSLLLLLLSYVFVDYLRGYAIILVVLSSQVLFRPFAVEWIYQIFEDYKYITIRGILFQFISLVLLFLLVHNEDDLYLYAGIVSFSACGANIVNFLHARKYIRIRLTSKIDLSKHIKPILLLFGMTITVVIYVSSDNTILGFICGDHSVGIYAVSVKVYTVIKTLLSAVIVVSIPRLSGLFGNKMMKEFKETAEDIYKTLLTLVFPCVIGIIILRNPIVFFLAGEEYKDAESSLVILSIALFFCTGAYFWGQCILVPMKREKDVFIITVISAVINLILNLILIPFWEENAAAFTTVIAEGCAFAYCRYKGGKLGEIKGFTGLLIKVIIGCAAIAGYGIFIESLELSMILQIIATIVGSVLIYIIIELLLKNDALYSVLKAIRSKIIKKAKNK